MNGRLAMGMAAVCTAFAVGCDGAKSDDEALHKEVFTGETAGTSDSTDDTPCETDDGGFGVPVADAGATGPGADGGTPSNPSAPGSPPATPTPPTTPPASTTPPKTTCEIFVHIHGGSPEWWSAWLPASTHLANGMLDPSAAQLASKTAGGSWPPPAAYAHAGNAYHFTTHGQCGSTDCACIVSENYSPILVDLADHGITLTAPNRGVRFDIEGTGTRMPIAWPADGRAAAFLTLDRDGNGQIDSVHEMFGNNTRGPDGRRADNGFEALRKYDTNADGVIDARDAVFGDLRLWSDVNRDALTDPGELTPLKDLVASISLAYVQKIERADVFGDESRQRSLVTLASGERRRAFDVWFVPGM